MDLKLMAADCGLRTAASCDLHQGRPEGVTTQDEARRTQPFAVRRSRPVRLLASLVALLVGVSLSPDAARAQDSGIEVGSPAPDATLETLDGKPAALAQWIGKTPIVMEFWATWCPNCKQLEPHLAAMHQKYGKQVQFITVAVSINQTPARVQQYVAKYKTPGVVLFDRKGDASGAYDVAATSFIVIVDRTGTVVYTGLGGAQKLEEAIRKAM